MMLRNGLSGAVVVLALGLLASPSLAKTNCHRLCKSELKACKPAASPCVGMTGAARTTCRRQERQIVGSCRGGIRRTCRTTGACA